jgi:hypothetical protein
MVQSGNKGLQFKAGSSDLKVLKLNKHKYQLLNGDSSEFKYQIRSNKTERMPKWLQPPSLRCNYGQLNNR